MPATLTRATAMEWAFGYAKGDKIRGKFVEVTADRTTRQFVSRGEISFTLDVKADSFTGAAIGKFYDLDNKLTAGPVSTAMNGTRVGL